MKTSSTYKLQRIQRSIAAGEKPLVQIRHEDGPRRVARLRSLMHSVELTLDRNAGFLVVDPDDIVSVLVRSQPTRDDT